jgi:8-oxo-dGTP pyrophosphatase MutT (NUDIX family)
MVGAEPVRRYSAARTLVLDPEGRALLLRWIDPEDGRAVWFTPGGGIEGGETPGAAALRELFEETGLRVADPGPCLMRLRTRSPRVIRDEHHFLVRAAGPLPPPPLPDPGTVGHRWWELAELERSRELFHPRNVAELVRRALGAVPAEPLQVEYELG